MRSRGVCNQTSKDCSPATKLEPEERSVNIESFIDALSTEQQQAALDLLWQRLSADAQSLTSPAWHGEVLEYRDASPSGKPKLPVPDAKIDVKRMVDERRCSR